MVNADLRDQCFLKTTPYSTKSPKVLLRNSQSSQIPPYSKVTRSEVPQEDTLIAS